MTRILLLAAGPILLAGCGLTQTKVVVITATPPRPTVSPSQTPVPPPAGLALNTADVPSDMQQSIGRFHSNSEVAQAYGLDPAQLTRRGRINSYETEFRGQAATGFLEIDNVVASWRTAAGARWDYARIVQATRHPNFKLLGFRAIRAPRLGDKSAVFEFYRKGQASNLRDYAVVFTRGRYRVYMQAVAVVDTVSDSDVLQLAHLIDKRIKSSR